MQNFHDNGRDSLNNNRNSVPGVDLRFMTNLQLQYMVICFVTFQQAIIK